MAHYSVLLSGALLATYFDTCVLHVLVLRVTKDKSETPIIIYVISHYKLKNNLIINFKINITYK